jgi:hypothetical protein
MRQVQVLVPGRASRADVGVIHDRTLRAVRGHGGPPHVEESRLMSRRGGTMCIAGGAVVAAWRDRSLT